jgi:hypothetical protein
MVIWAFRNEGKYIFSYTIVGADMKLCTENWVITIECQSLMFLLYCNMLIYIFIRVSNSRAYIFLAKLGLT